MLINRIGTFFILLGLFLVGLYFLSDIAKSPTCGYFVAGLVSASLGVFLWFRDPVPPGPPSNRFRLLKGLTKKSDKK